MSHSHEICERYVLAAAITASRSDIVWPDAIGPLEIYETIGSDRGVLYHGWIQRAFFDVIVPMAMSNGVESVTSPSVALGMSLDGIYDPKIRIEDDEPTMLKLAEQSLGFLLHDERRANAIDYYPNITGSETRSRIATLRELHSKRRIQAAALAISGNADARTSTELRSAFVDAVDDSDRDASSWISGEDYVSLAGPTPPGEVGIKTGLDCLDSVIQLHPGRLYVVVADTGHGKSNLVGQWAEHLAYHQGKTVAWFSTEMQARESAQRTLSRMARVDIYKVESGQMISDAERRRMDEARNVMSRGKFSFCDVSGRGFSEVSSRAHSRGRSGELDLIVIDHMHNMKRGDEVRLDIGRDFAEAKAMAKRLQVPVIAVAQANREGKKGELRKHHLRESGAIEDEADMIIILLRPNIDPDGGLPQGHSEEVVILVDKHRHGQSPVRKSLRFHGASVLFESVGQEVYDKW